MKRQMKSMIIKAPGDDAPLPVRRAFPAKRDPGRLYIGYWSGFKLPKPTPPTGRVRTIPEPPPYEVQVKQWEEEQAHRDGLPDPRDFVDESWDPAERDLVVDYLKTAKTDTRWMGVSFCRFNCGIDEFEMGSRCYTDGTYVWPQGFAHYLEHHAVKPDQSFIDHIRARVAYRQNR